jgi:hypothetical protein
LTRWTLIVDESSLDPLSEGTFLFINQIEEDRVIWEE